MRFPGQGMAEPRAQPGGAASMRMAEPRAPPGSAASVMAECEDETALIKASFLEAAPVKGSIDVAYDGAWLAYSEGRHGAALAMLDNVLSTVSDHERARFARGLCLLGLDRPREAERELTEYLRLVAYQQLNPCDALYFRAMALSRLRAEQRALSDLDKAIAAKPGCNGGCACGMNCRAAEAILARFALLLEPGTYAEYLRAAQPAAAGAPPAASAAGAQAAGERASSREGARARLAFTLDGPRWSVPMHQLHDALQRARALGKVPLLVDSSAEHAADASFLYGASTIVELKRLVLGLHSGQATLEGAREELRRQLVHAMRWGHHLVLRLGTSAPDWSRLCSAEHFPAELLADASAMPVGANLVGHALDGVLRSGDAQAGVFVVSERFGVVVTCNFAADTFERYLAPSLGHCWDALQPVCIVTETSFRDGKAEPQSESGGVGAAERAGVS